MKNRLKILKLKNNWRAWRMNFNNFGVILAALLIICCILFLLGAYLNPSCNYGVSVYSPFLFFGDDD